MVESGYNRTERLIKYRISVCGFQKPFRKHTKTKKNAPIYHTKIKKKKKNVHLFKSTISLSNRMFIGRNKLYFYSGNDSKNKFVLKMCLFFFVLCITELFKKFHFKYLIRDCPSRISTSFMRSPRNFGKLLNTFERIPSYPTLIFLLACTRDWSARAI